MDADVWFTSWVNTSATVIGDQDASAGYWPWCVRSVGATPLWAAKPRLRQVGGGGRRPAQRTETTLAPVDWREGV